MALERSDCELLQLDKATSTVWQYFGFPAKEGKFLEPDKKKRNRVCCKLCSRDFSYVGNTTNMWQHLKEAHPCAYANAKLSGEVTVKSTDSTRGCTSNLTDVSSSGTSKQIQITEAFTRAQPLPHSSQRWKSITNSVCHFVAKGMHPFQTVNEPGFRQLLQSLEPRYEPPDRKSLANNYMRKLYERERGNILDKISCIDDYSFTTDFWTSCQNRSYGTITIHYIGSDYVLCSHLLETKEITQAHTGMNIAEEIRGIMDEWDLSLDQVSAVTTDNASNMVLAMNVLEWTRIPCFSHSLQLAVEDALKLPQVSHALARCRRLVSHFHHSTKSTYLLRQKQVDLHQEQLCLIRDVQTRWNSSYYMAERIILMQQPLSATLYAIRKGDLMPSDREFTILEEYIDTMKPVVEITEAIGGEKWVTISTVRPLLHKLLEDYLKCKHLDSKLKKDMKTAMADNLAGRYVQSALMFLNVSTFLDPRFKLPSFLTEEEKQPLLEFIEAEVIESIDNTLVTVKKETEDTEKEGTAPPRKKLRGERQLLHLIGDVCKPSTTDTDTSQRAKSEMRRYMDEEPCEISPLIWWKENEGRYPALSKMARKYLALPATSTPSERAFSIAGSIVNKKRACLLPENVNMLVFLYENLPK